MDYKDYERGHKGTNFWFKGKCELIGILLNKTNKKGMKILDIGAGTGEDLDVLNNFGSCYVLDINLEALEQVPENLCIDKKCGDANNLPYESEFFDLVVAFDVFEHIDNDYKALDEIKRVLKPDGLLVFTVPAFQFLYGPHDKALDHKRRYSRKTLSQLLSTLNCIYLNYWNFFMFLPIATFRLIRKNATPNVDPFTFNKSIDNMLYFLLQIENKLVKKSFKLPFGLSLIGICKKL